MKTIATPDTPEKFMQDLCKATGLNRNELDERLSKLDEILSKPAVVSPNLTPFDKLMIDEAYARCYGLREAVQRGDLAELAHQTGFRLSYLTDLSNAVIAHSEDTRSARSPEL